MPSTASSDALETMRFDAAFMMRVSMVTVMGMSTQKKMKVAAAVVAAAPPFALSCRTMAVGMRNRNPALMVTV